MIGQPLKMDASVASLCRPNVARFCVKVDVTKTLLKRFWIGNSSSRHWQYITYKDLPSFCSYCLMLGHSLDECRVLHPKLFKKDTNVGKKQQTQSSKKKDRIGVDKFKGKLSEP
ncbi:hypothetical protein ACH5RR_007263 [Cinchona calisaya]|uniref:Uncharacterized protein n=1 Tax=Cinchona calisaya TaxID=153742 RepID=A0ABD3ARS6_9GENT